MEDHIKKMKDTYGWTERNEEINTMYLDNWKKSDQGFFVAGKGCRIPYKERSAICISFTCGKMTPEQRDAGHAAGHHLYGWR